MSEFFKAAARCDITVVKDSPVPLDEKSIIEGEIKARQWDTLGNKIAVEKEIYDEIRNVQLDKQRQREQEERMRKLRLEEKRKEAVEKRETERAAKAEMQKQKNEDIELQRISIIEAKRQELAADRAKARAKMEEKAYQEVQRRLQTTGGIKSLEDQAEAVDPNNLTYMDRIRIEKERLGRMAQQYNNNASITALYDDSTKKDAAPRTKTRLEHDLTQRREMERSRIEEEHKRLLDEDAEDEAREKTKKRDKNKQKKAEHEGWLMSKQRQEEEEHRIKEEHEAAEIAKKSKKHPIDDMHAVVEREFMEEQEALAVVDENLTMGYSHLDRLEQFMDAEKDAWRDQVQYEREVHAGVLQ